MQPIKFPPVSFCRALVLLGAALACGASAQQAQNVLPDAPAPSPQQQTQAGDKDAPTLRNLPRNILYDQAGIWTSPLRIRAHDLLWLLPLGAATGAAIATDTTAMRDEVSRDKGFNNGNTTASNVLVGSMIFTPAVFYGVGLFNDDDHSRETGLLGAEAMGDAVVVEQGMKLVFWRERPDQHNARGDFFQTNVGWDSSFPSSHTVIAWSAAAVIASEYPHPLPVILSYTGATAIALTRVLGQQHFPSDVLVGSAAGWLIGHYVYRKHHRWVEQKGWVPVKPLPNPYPNHK